MNVKFGEAYDATVPMIDCGPCHTADIPEPDKARCRRTPEAARAREFPDQDVPDVDVTDADCHSDRILSYRMILRYFGWCKVERKPCEEQRQNQRSAVIALSDLTGPPAKRSAAYWTEPTSDLPVGQGLKNLE